MWFKNARIYSVALNEQLSAIFKDPATLEEKLQSAKFKKATDLEVQSCGFVPVFGRNTDSYAFSFKNNHFFKFVEENKLLPSSIINQALLDEIENKEAELNRPLKKNEKAALKTAITNKLLARAFTTQKELLVWVNTQYNFCAISVSSAKRAENAITFLRKALGGSFPAKSFQPRCVVEDRLTSFIAKNDLPEGFALGSDTVLKSNDDEGSTVRISRDVLNSEEVINHINAGKVVTELQLNFADCLSFVLTSDLSLKRINLNDQYLEVNLPQKSDDAVTDLQSFLIVQSEALTSLILSIVKTFDCDIAQA